jgi:hypothetical protein
LVCAAILGFLPVWGDSARAVPVQPAATSASQVVTGVVTDGVGVRIDATGNVQSTATVPVQVYRARVGDTVIVTVVPG